MVLMAFSKYFETKLQSWTEDRPTSKKKSTTAQTFEVALPVPAGQQDLAELLIKGIYQKQPSITADLSHAQLLQLLLLADRFEVPKVQAAALQALSEVPVEQLDWQTVLALLDLPAVCAEQPEQFKAVQDLAVKRLLHDLGDLEAVWGSEQLQQQLLGLPFAALKQLLQHPETRVASENTVVYTIRQWYQQQQPDGIELIQQLRELMWLVRLPQCSPYYISTIMTQSELVTQCFTHLELCVAQQCSSSPAALAAYQQAKSPLLERFPVWAAGKRPASIREQAIVWHMPLSKLQSVVEQGLEAAPTLLQLHSSSHVLQGQPLAVLAQMKLGSSTSGSSASRQLVMGLYIVCQQLPPDAVRQVVAKFTVAAVKKPAAPRAAQQRSPPDVVKGPTPIRAISPAESDWGFHDVISLGEVSSWAAAEAALRARQLVHLAGHEGQAEPYLSIRADLVKLQ